MLLKKGSSGDDVKKIQKKLGLTADGEFGAGTEKAVKKWQIENGLKADGIIGNNTWKKMFPEKEEPKPVKPKPVSQNQPTEQPIETPPLNKLLKKGSSGPEVKMMQKKLGMAEDGEFGPNTEKAVKKWQKENGLVADGVIGKNSWKKMFADSGTPKTDEQTKPVDQVIEIALPFEILKKGSSGPEAKMMQKKLGLTDDGIFGAGTEKAVKKWQKENGLVVDGLIGINSWKKMFPETVFVTPAVPKAVNLKKLKGHLPENVLTELTGIAKKYNINNIYRLAHFLAQCHHESGGFKFISENLYYRADSLRRVFGKYFSTTALAQQYERKPSKIASRVYANRMGNGEEASGDGFKYRGRGYIQLTGKNNYKAFATFINDDVVANPVLVADRYPLTSACFFFEKNNIWDICDRGAGQVVLKAVTKKVNGGYNGLNDRIKHFEEYYNLLK